jgi:hypothetical protein
MARYRSNNGDLVFNNAVRKSGIDWGRDEGAGSIVGKSGLVVSTLLIDAVLPVRPSQPAPRRHDRLSSPVLTRWPTSSLPQMFRQSTL